jgi:hypothetical protein
MSIPYIFNPLGITPDINTGGGGDDNTTSYAFSISGITNPAEANGNYIEQSTGIYKHETNGYYVSRDTVAVYWCLSSIKNPVSPAYANFYAINSSGITNPWDATEWVANTSGSDV